MSKLELILKQSNLDRKLRIKLRSAYVEELKKIAQQGILQDFRGEHTDYANRDRVLTERGTSSKVDSSQLYGVNPVQRGTPEISSKETGESLSTRYVPGKPGLSAERVIGTNGGVFKDPVTNKIYDWNEGFVDENGQKYNPGSIQGQTEIFSYSSICDPAKLKKIAADKSPLGDYKVNRNSVGPHDYNLSPDNAFKTDGDSEYSTGSENPDVSGAFPQTIPMAIMAQNEYQMTIGELADSLNMSVDIRFVRRLASELSSDMFSFDLFKIRRTDSEGITKSLSISDLARGTTDGNVPVLRSDWVALTDKGFNLLSDDSAPSWNPEEFLRGTKQVPDLYDPESTEDDSIFDTETPIADMSSFPDPKDELYDSMYGNSEDLDTLKIRHNKT